jgi:hypothetical protein
MVIVANFWVRGGVFLPPGAEARRGMRRDEIIE